MDASTTHQGLGPTDSSTGMRRANRMRKHHTSWHAEITGITWDSRRWRGTTHPSPQRHLRVDED